MKIGKKVAVGMGLGMAAAAAGYYFFASKDAAKRRKQIAAWAKEFKAEVVAQAKRLKKLDEKVVKKIVADTSKAYAKLKTVDQRDLSALVGELNANWRAIKNEAVGAGKSVARAARKVTKKMAATPVKRRK